MTCFSHSATGVFLCLPVSICAYLCLSVLTCVYLCLPMSIYVYLCLSVLTCVYLCLPVSICAYLCLSVSICAYLCTFAFRVGCVSYCCLTTTPPHTPCFSLAWWNVLSSTGCMVSEVYLTSALPIKWLMLDHFPNEISCFYWM